MMERIISSKRAAIGATLTWMVATSIIVFLIIIYLVFVAGIKIIDKEDMDIIPLKTIENSLDSTIVLRNILDSETNSGNIQEIILDSLDNYMDDLFYFNQISQDINSLWKYYPLPDFFNDYVSDKEKERIMRQEIKKILDLRCQKYFFKIPQGIISEKGEGFLALTSLDDRELFSSDKEIREWNDWTEMFIPYKGKLIEIKYRMLKKC